MSKLFSLWVCSISLFGATASFADDVASGLPAEAVQVSGLRAKTLLEALKAAGAQERVLIDFATLTVSDVSVVAGFLPPRGQFASFSAQQTIFGTGGSHTARIVDLKANGATAREIFEALKDAGVKPNQQVENATIEAKSIECGAGLVPGGPHCTITIAE